MTRGISKEKASLPVPRESAQKHPRRGPGKDLGCLLIVLIAVAFVASLTLSIVTDDVSEAGQKEGYGNRDHDDKFDEEDNSYYFGISNVHFKCEGTKLIIYTKGEGDCLVGDWFDEYGPTWKDNRYVKYKYMVRWDECTEIEIRDGVTSFCDNAFSDCPNLTTVTVGDSVKNLGYYAFKGCPNLKNVKLSNSLQEIHSCAFQDCTSLESITIPDSVRTIGSEAFRNCSALTSVNIGGSVQTIGPLAFEGCTSLKSVTIGNPVEYISDFAFQGCTSLESVTIGNSVKFIGNYAFRGCTSLNAVYCNAPGLDASSSCWPSSGDILFIDGNGGYYTGGALGPYKKAFPAAKDSFLRDGFMRFSTAKDGTGTTYMPGDYYELEGKQVVYAIWGAKCGDSLYWSLDGTDLTVSVFVYLEG